MQAHSRASSGILTALRRVRGWRCAHPALIACAALIAGCGAESDAASELGQTAAQQPKLASAASAAIPTPPRFPAGAPSPNSATAVATFESIGLSWSPTEGGEAVECLVRYRRADSSAWQRGFSLWYDARDGEYRGSLVHLRPGTQYEIQLSLAGANEATRLEARTWSERFPIARTVLLPEHSAEPLVIRESGSADGYVLYAPRPGRSATIDVEGEAESNVVVEGSYVIVRGLELKNAQRNGITLAGAAHDVVIEENDISGWGRVEPDGWGKNMDAAVYAEREGGKAPERLIIQRNRLHHPRSDSNAWDEYREAHETSHPLGPQGISILHSAGNHVIRYNEIYSDPDHKFNDCIGGGENYSDRGFPNRDSDIYGNRISHCWDDAIEAEGANRNVRVWGNYIDMSYVMVAVAPTVSGPIYIWRNVADRSRSSAKKPMEKAKRGVFLKSQSKKLKRPTKDDPDRKKYFGGGRIYVFHNTLYQRAGEAQGVYAGLADLSSRMTNVVSRNNILYVNEDWRPSVMDTKDEPSNDLDFDLYNGKARGYQANGIKGAPIFVADSGDGKNGYALSPESPGYDAGLPLPNFNDGDLGEGPDMGAQEAGLPPLEFGVDAYR